MNKKKFLELVDRHDPSTMDDVKYRIVNREMLRESQSIALKIIAKLDELGMSQSDLAKELDVYPQQITKFVSGKTNFEIQTLIKIQQILDIPLLASYYEKKSSSHASSIKFASKHTLRLVHIVSPEKYPKSTVKRKSSKIEYLHAVGEY